MLSGRVSEDIRTSYTGGAVDMYISQPFKGKQIYAYDVNALYPYVMTLNKFPIGNPTFFNGDIFNIDPNAFGFFFCKILSPSYFKHPVLKTPQKSKRWYKNNSTSW